MFFCEAIKESFNTFLSIIINALMDSVLRVIAQLIGAKSIDANGVSQQGVRQLRA